MFKDTINSLVIKLLPNRDQKVVEDTAAYWLNADMTMDRQFTQEKIERLQRALTTLSTELGDAEEHNFSLGVGYIAQLGAEIESDIRVLKAQRRMIEKLNNL